MKPKTTLFGLILVLGLAVAIGGVWMVVRQASVQRQVLPDGSVVTFHGVTYGREHRLPSGNLWQRMAGRLLPSDLARRFGIPMVTHTTTNDSLMVWWELSSSPNARNTFYSTLEVVIADEHGNEFVAADYPVRSGVTTLLRGGVFRLVPRGSERLAVRMRFSDLIAGTDGLATFDVGNPAGKVESQWQGHSLPVTSRLDELEIVLTDLSPSPPSVGPSRALAGWMVANARFSVPGQPTTNWQLCGVEVFDETGGSYRPGVGTLSDGSLRFHGSLSATTVWKLRLAVCQVGGFESNQLSIFRDVPLEGLARATFAPRSNIVNGLTLTLFDVTTGRPRSLNLTTMPPDDEVMVVLSEVIDDQGRRHGARLVGPGPLRGSRQRGYMSFPMDRALNSKSIDVAFGISRLRYVEMLVKPSSTPTHGASTFRTSDK